MSRFIGPREQHATEVAAGLGYTSINAYVSAMYERSVSLAEMGRTLGLSATAVNERRARMGLEPRGGTWGGHHKLPTVTRVAARIAARQAHLDYVMESLERGATLALQRAQSDAARRRVQAAVRGTWRRWGVEVARDVRM
jgi:hypothetical protein